MIMASILVKELKRLNSPAINFAVEGNHSLLADRILKCEKMQLLKLNIIDKVKRSMALVSVLIPIFSIVEEIASLVITSSPSWLDPSLNISVNPTSVAVVVSVMSRRIICNAS